MEKVERKKKRREGNRDIPNTKYGRKNGGETEKD